MGCARGPLRPRHLPLEPFPLVLRPPFGLEGGCGGIDGEVGFGSPSPAFFVPPPGRGSRWNATIEHSTPASACPAAEGHQAGSKNLLGWSMLVYLLQELRWGQVFVSPRAAWQCKWFTVAQPFLRKGSGQDRQRSYAKALRRRAYHVQGGHSLHVVISHTSRYNILKRNISYVQNKGAYNNAYIRIYRNFQKPTHRVWLQNVSHGNITKGDTFQF